MNILQQKSPVKLTVLFCIYCFWSSLFICCESFADIDYKAYFKPDELSKALKEYKDNVTKYRRWTPNPEYQGAFSRYASEIQKGSIAFDKKSFAKLLMLAARNENYVSYHGLYYDSKMIIKIMVENNVFNENFSEYLEIVYQFEKKYFKMIFLSTLFVYTDLTENFAIYDNVWNHLTSSYSPGDFLFFLNTIDKGRYYERELAEPVFRKIWSFCKNILFELKQYTTIADEDFNFKDLKQLKSIIDEVSQLIFYMPNFKIINNLLGDLEKLEDPKLMEIYVHRLSLQPHPSRASIEAAYRVALKMRASGALIRFLDFKSTGPQRIKQIYGVVKQDLYSIILEAVPLSAHIPREPISFLNNPNCPPEIFKDILVETRRKGNWFFYLFVDILFDNDRYLTRQQFPCRQEMLEAIHSIDDKKFPRRIAHAPFAKWFAYLDPSSKISKKDLIKKYRKRCALK